MKIDLLHTFVDAEDKPILDKESPITAKELLKRAVLADIDENGQPIRGEDKVKRFDLFMKIRTADADIVFDPDEVALLNRAVRVFPTLICGQLSYLLSGK